MATKKTESKEEKKTVKEKAEEKKPEKKKLTEAEYEKKILELAKTGLTSEKIGEALRKEGIHPSEYNKKISKILKEKEIYVNPDLKNVEEKLNKLQEHYQKNKQDKRALKDREKIFARLRKLKAYFSR